MAGKARTKRWAPLSAAYRVTKGSSFRLAEIDPGDTQGIKDKKKAQEALAAGIQELAALQETLYAQNQWGMLLIFQGIFGPHHFSSAPVPITRSSALLRERY